MNGKGEPMSDLISKQAAIDALKEEEYPCESDYDEGYMAALDKAVWIMEKWMPSAQPERKTGRWIFIRPTKEDRLYVACDQCGQVEAWDENCGMLCALIGEKYAHYCPNCGAYMGGDT